MPRGIYPKTKEHIEKIKVNLILGHSKEAREKARQTLKNIASNPEWREKVSRSTCKAMRDPTVRQKHLQGLARAFAQHGVNFQGGNGQGPVEIIKLLEPVLTPAGFLREYIVPTKYQSTSHLPPTHYKIDFAHPQEKIAIELDGPCHRNLKQRAKDEKKTQVLESLGWKVVRIKH